jgi:hypothetical protein
VQRESTMNFARQRVRTMYRSQLINIASKNGFITRRVMTLSSSELLLSSLVSGEQPAFSCGSSLLVRTVLGIEDRRVRPGIADGRRHSVMSVSEQCTWTLIEQARSNLRQLRLVVSQTQPDSGHDRPISDSIARDSSLIPVVFEENRALCNALQQVGI